MKAILSYSFEDDVEILPEPFRAVIKRCLVVNAGERAKDAKELIALLRNEEYAFIKPAVGDNDATQIMPKEERKNTNGEAAKNKVGKFADKKTSYYKWIISAGIFLAVFAIGFFVYPKLIINSFEKNGVFQDSIANRTNISGIKAPINAKIDKISNQAENYPTRETSIVNEEHNSVIKENILKNNMIVINERSYFYNEPNEITKRKGYLVKGEMVLPLKIENEFVYIEFTNNSSNRTTKGWILLNTLKNPF